MCTVRERLQKSYCPRLTFFCSIITEKEGSGYSSRLAITQVNVKSSIIDYLFSLNSEQDFECTTCVFAFLIQLSGLHELFIIVDMINLFDICKLRADIYHTTILLWSTINVNFKTNLFTIHIQKQNKSVWKSMANSMAMFSWI